VVLARKSSDPCHKTLDKTDSRSPPFSVSADSTGFTDWFSVSADSKGVTCTKIVQNPAVPGSAHSKGLSGKEKRPETKKAAVVCRLVASLYRRHCIGFDRNCQAKSEGLCDRFKNVPWLTSMQRTASSRVKEKIPTEDTRIWNARGPQDCGGEPARRMADFLVEVREGTFPAGWFLSY